MIVKYMHDMILTTGWWWGLCRSWRRNWWWGCGRGCHWTRLEIYQSKYKFSSKI